MILTTRLKGEDCTKFKEALRQIRYCKLVYDLVDLEGVISSAGMDLPIIKSASRELEDIALVTRLLQKAKYAYREGKVNKLQAGQSKFPWIPKKRKAV